ncbi:MAG: ABC transporter permease [Candidatus Firestonebacteria bacterium]|nr:ABC transporter permease [Candidatus Firestonebacteria bacterium]
MAFSTDLRIAFRNLGRNPKRTALGVGAIFLAQVAVLWFMSFIHGYENLVFEAVTGPMLGHAQIHAEQYRKKHELWNSINQASHLMTHLEKNPAINQVVPRAYAPVLAALQENGETALITGLDWDKEIHAQGLLEDFLPKDLPGSGEVLLGANLAQVMGVKPGDTLALIGQSADGAPAGGLFKVKGTVSTALDSVNRKGILMSLPALQKFLGMPDGVHEIMLRVKTPAELPSLIAALRHDPDLRGLEILSWQTLQPQLATLLKTFAQENRFILVLIFITAAAGIANTMLMAGFERTHEFGVLLALGCRPRRLITTLIYESLALGLSGVLLGTLAGAGLVAWEFSHGLTFGGLKDFAMMGIRLKALHPFLLPSDIIRSVLCVAITALLASWWPAERVVKLNPLEAMRS